MGAKLTARVPKHLLANAKRYTQAHNTTLTALISVYLQQLISETDILDRAPFIRQMIGVLSPETSTDDYKQHLEDKYDVREITRNVRDYQPALMKAIQPVELLAVL